MYKASIGRKGQRTLSEKGGFKTIEAAFGWLMTQYSRDEVVVDVSALGFETDHYLYAITKAPEKIFLVKCWGWSEVTPEKAYYADIFRSETYEGAVQNIMAYWVTPETRFLDTDTGIMVVFPEPSDNFLIYEIIEKTG